MWTQNWQAFFPGKTYQFWVCKLYSIHVGCLMAKLYTLIKYSTWTYVSLGPLALYEATTGGVDGAEVDPPPRKTNTVFFFRFSRGRIHSCQIKNMLFTIFTQSLSKLGQNVWLHSKMLIFKNNLFHNFLRFFLLLIKWPIKH